MSSHSQLGTDAREARVADNAPQQGVAHEGVPWVIARTLASTMHLASIALLLLSTQVFARQSGLAGHIDLDGDSIKDEIRSGPSSLFGNAGGPLVVILSANDSSPEVSYLIEGNGRFAVESFGGNSPLRLWSYWHVSSTEGVLTSYRFTKSGFESSRITIHPGDGGTDTGRAIFAAIFREDNAFVLNRISPYEPPPHPLGKEWGE